MPAVIEVEQLRKAYGTFEAVRDVSFRVQQGEIFGILGPNGAGKTTTVECIQGLRQPSGGSIRVLGLDAIRQRSQLKRRIGSQLQESALPDRIKVWEALDLFASLESGGPDWRLLLEQWGLNAKAKSSFTSLSGGQRQPARLPAAALLAFGHATRMSYPPRPPRWRKHVCDSDTVPTSLFGLTR